MENVRSDCHIKYDIVKAINNKTFSELDYNFQQIFDKLIKYKPKKVKFKAKICSKTIQPDIMVKYFLFKRYLNVKTLNSTLLGISKIDDFIKFLDSFKISNETKDTILMFIYADGTKNGSGKYRYSQDELISLMRNKIIDANRELNKNKDLVRAFADAIVFKGKPPLYINSDFLYQGDAKFGFMCSRKEILKYATNNLLSYMKTIHIGPILLKAFFKKGKDEVEKIDTVAFRWVNLSDSMEFISKKG